MVKRPSDSASEQSNEAAVPGATKPGAAKASESQRPKNGPPNAFDLWLKRELRDMFSDVASEPVPDELLRLNDEKKKKPKPRPE